MKAIFFLAAIVAIFLIAANTGGISGPASAQSARAVTPALPVAQRTAIYAPLGATQTAARSVATVEAAQYAAQEQEAARVYAQAQADEANKRRIVATQQAALATQAANDVAMSKEQATMAAVSFMATKEAISNTIAISHEQYLAQIASIQLNKTASQDATQKIVDAQVKRGLVDELIDWLWSRLWQIVSIIAVALIAAGVVVFFIVMLRKFPPPVTIQEIEVPAPASTTAPAGEGDPPPNIMAGLNFSSADDRTRLLDILKFSGRKYGWLQNRIAGKDDIPGLSGRMWDAAKQWGIDHGYDIVTQRGPAANGGGTFVPGEIGSLKVLHDRIFFDPVVAAIPAAAPAPQGVANN